MSDTKFNIGDRVINKRNKAAGEIYEIDRLTMPGVERRYRIKYTDYDPKGIVDDVLDLIYNGISNYQLESDIVYDFRYYRNERIDSILGSN